MIDVTLDDFQSYLEESGVNLEDFLSNREDAITEMFETGSAEFYVANKCYVFALTIVETKPN